MVKRDLKSRMSFCFRRRENWRLGETDEPAASGLCHVQAANDSQLLALSFIE